MTLQEVCRVLGKSEGTIKKNFKRTQENLAKKGIILTRAGIGETAIYKVEYKELPAAEGE